MQHASEQDYFDQRKHLLGAMKLGFGSTYTQSCRYGTLTRGLDLTNKSCLLLGCGEGAGVPFLQAQGCENIYGADLIERHVVEARKRYPDLSNRFAVVDSTAEALARSYDWVIASGTWNVKTATDKYEKIAELLSYAGSRISVGIATNFTTHIEGDEEAHSFCYMKVLEMFSARFNKWRVDHTYLNNDFSIWGYEPR